MKPRSEEFLVLSVVIFSSLTLSVIAKESYKGYKLLSATPATEEQVKYLKDLWLGDNKFDLDFWKPPSNPGRSVEILVPPKDAEDLQNDLAQLHITFEVKIADLKQLVQNESEANSSPRSRVFYDAIQFKLDRYHDFSEIEAYVRRQARKDLSIVKLQVIGKSHEKRPLLLLKIGKPLNGKNGAKPAMWIDAGIHAREWITPAVALYFIHKLINGYNKDPEITRILNKIDIYILPVVNPDGYHFSRTQERMWRKNRSPCIRTGWWGQKCCGVDLNRNFDWKWSTAGSSRSPCKDVYHGKNAFSEPETAAVRDFVLSHKQTLKAFISMHSYGQMWMLPFGHRRNAYPNDHSVLLEVAQNASKALTSAYGTAYKIGTGANLLYSAAGSSEDWAKGVAKIKFSYLLELRPTDESEGGFILPNSKIIPTAKETLEAVKAVAKQIIVRYPAAKENGSDTRRTQNGVTKSPSSPIERRTLGSTTTTAVCVDLASSSCRWYRWIPKWMSPCRSNSNVKRMCRKSCGLC